MIILDEFIEVKSMILLIIKITVGRILIENDYISYF